MSHDRTGDNKFSDRVSEDGKVSTSSSASAKAEVCGSNGPDGNGVPMREREFNRGANSPFSNDVSSVNDNENDFESLEYEEDVYYRGVGATPSFDDIDELSDTDEIVVHCWRGSNGEIEEIVVDDSFYCVSVETDFVGSQNDNCEIDGADSGGEKFLTATSNTQNNNGINGSSNKIKNAIFSAGSSASFKKKKSVRVIFQDLSKPYLARISSSQNYKKFLEIVKGEEASPHAGTPLSPSDDPLARGILEERELRREEWTAELAKVEEEIQTLRHVLASKVKVSQDLKRKLGIGPWKELTDDVNQGLRNVKESQVFQKTESVIKTTAEKTTSILGGFGSGISMKLGQMRNSESFRSLEERVGSAYENVKTKVVPSRSNSTQSFDEALREAEATRRASAVPLATSPTIPEDKLLS